METINEQRLDRIEVTLQEISGELKAIVRLQERQTNLTIRLNEFEEITKNNNHRIYAIELSNSENQIHFKKLQEENQELGSAINVHAKELEHLRFYRIIISWGFGIVSLVIGSFVLKYFNL